MAMLVYQRVATICTVKNVIGARYPGSLAGAMNQLDLTFEWGYTYGYVYNI